MGDESLGFIHHAMKEAKRLEMDLGLICASGWNSGGSWVPPEMASKNLFSAGVVVTGPGEVRENLPFPEVPRNCPKGKMVCPPGTLTWPSWHGPIPRRC